MWFNPMMTWLLRSPFHSFVSKNTMLITYKGRKSGKAFTTPVNYLRLSDEQGEYLATTSYRERTWWRSLRGGAEVALRVQGKDLAASAEVIEDEAGVSQALGAYLRQWPGVAKYFGVQLEADGQPNMQDVVEAAKTRVVIKTRLMRAS
jgi:deazaflavin-dependent oxidoreductase (nitroreductase family)